MTLLSLLRHDGSEPTPDPAPAASAISIRERPPLWLATEITSPTGGRYRWAGDEPDPANKPSGRRFSSSMPGGFDTCDQVLPRKPGIDYPDLVGLSDMTVTGAGGEIAWQGRLERSPRVSGDQVAISPSAQGYKARLGDHKNVSELYRDADLARWGGPSASWRLRLIAANFPHQQDASAAWDQTAPALILVVNGTWASPTTPICDAWYDAGSGNRIAAITADWSGDTNTAFQLIPAVSSDGALTASESGGDVYTTATGTLSFAPTARYRYARISWAYNATPAGNDGASFEVRLRNLAVTGAHGLPLRGSGADVGYFASDIVRHALGSWAPGIAFTDESIQQTSFIIGQAVFAETTLSDLIAEVDRYELRDWAIWEGPTFWYTARGAVGRRWRARVGPARLEETGPAVDRVWNGVVISYRDTDGSSRTVGPPGSGADTEDALLADGDPDNVANQAGILKYERFDMGIGVSASAIRVGYRFLTEAKLLDQSGRAQLVGTVVDDRGVERPAWQVRAGDYISFVDAADSSYRRIVRAEYQEDSYTTSVDLDAPPEAMQVLLARLGLAVASVG